MKRRAERDDKGQEKRVGGWKIADGEERTGDAFSTRVASLFLSSSLSLKIFCYISSLTPQGTQVNMGEITSQLLHLHGAEACGDII